MAVHFGDTFTNESFNCFYLGKYVSAPEPKLAQVEIPYADGALDITDLFGPVRYNLRTITIRMELMKQLWQIDAAMRDIYRELHGKQMKIWFDEEASMEWSGRLAVNAPIINGSSASLSVVATVNPFKVTKLPTQQKEWTVSGSQTTRSLTTTSLRSYPRFTTDGENLTVKFDGVTYSLPDDAQSFAIPGLWLPAGVNYFYLNGTGSINCDLYGGAL